ncbi:hypothetical protein LJR066_002734 [Acidovorax sp. LjRoot66]
MISLFPLISADAEIGLEPEIFGKNSSIDETKECDSLPSAHAQAGGQ